MARELLFSYDRRHFRVDTFRGQGPGGQHRNKTESAVRITHLETGLSASSQSDRSQHANRKLAFRRLVDLLIAHHLGDQRKARYEAGHRIIRTYHEPDDRVVDHDTRARYSYRQTVGKNDLGGVIEDRAKALAGT